jgi:hypothetical protein
MSYFPQQRPRRTFLTLALAVTLALAGCTGVPLRSIPRMLQLQNELLESNPAEFMVGLQVDARFVPPAGAVPALIIKIQARETGAFETVDKKLPLQVAVVSGAALGLDAPANGRRWLIYSMPLSTQAELQRIHVLMRQNKAQGKGATMGIGLEQESLAVTDAVLANTRWDTWLQVKQRDGFFEVWSGTLAQIRNAAAKGS